LYKIIIAGDGRVLSAATGDSAITGAVEVDTLPDGNIHDYRYVDGAYMHDPEPEPEPEPPPTPMEQLQAEVAALQADNTAMLLALADMIGGTTNGA